MLSSAPARIHIAAFTLVEMLAVTAIITLLMGLVAPALKSMSSGAGRRGAINQLLATFDQARVAAIRSASQAYVGFADSTFPNVDMRYRSFILFRPRLESDHFSVSGHGTSRYVYLTRWKTLPKGISIKAEQNSLVGTAGATIDVSPEDKFPNLRMGLLPVIVFNSTGGVSRPVDSNALKVFLYQGFFEMGRDVIIRGNRIPFDVISISRFTGRPILEASSIGE